MKAALAIIASLLLGTCSQSPSTLDQILSAGELRVVTLNSPSTYYLGAEGPQGPEYDLAVLAAIAYHQPISRDGLKDIFGKEISRDLIGRLAERDLIGTGPREPRRGAPHTFVTTEAFLAAFGMESLRDLPDPEQLDDAGLAGPSGAMEG